MARFVLIGNVSGDPERQELAGCRLIDDSLSSTRFRPSLLRKAAIHRREADAPKNIAERSSPRPLAPALTVES